MLKQKLFPDYICNKMHNMLSQYGIYLLIMCHNSKTAINPIRNPPIIKKSLIFQ